MTTYSSQASRQPNALEYRRTSFPIDPLFVTRWSPRAYSEQPIDQQTLFTILEAARWAPSAGNLQPWRFVIARTPEDRARFCSFINDRNVLWCKRAPVLVVLCSCTFQDGKPIRSHAFDAGTAWGFLALQAAQLGVFAHAMAGFDPAKARQVLALPAEYEPQVVISLGYYGDPAQLPEDLQAREKPSQRRSLCETVFEGTFGRPVAELSS
ncbi:MAG: nitroreductase family protein [Alicyclobacillus sp.]|nr:nitroreductase family protein [Alicyclobacillus sp.]